MDNITSGSGVDVRWDVRDGRLWLACGEHEVWWEVPSDFKLPSYALLDLATYLLLTGLGVKVGVSVATREYGSGIGLAYSGGVDSTAALRLLPQARPLYTQVSNPGGHHKIENALLALQEVGGTAVLTNSEELAEAFGKRRGYYGPGAFTITAVLFSDYYDLGTVADGNVLETIYLYGAGGHGTKYHLRDLSRLESRFAQAGLHYCLPCAGLTEVSTTRIAADSRFAMGCMRGSGGLPCNNCMKCYRKNALQGKPVRPSRESESKINRDIIPMLPSLLWAVREGNLVHPVLGSIRKDIDWVGQWYPDSIRHVPPHLRMEVAERIAGYGIRPVQDDRPIREWVSDRASG